MKYSCSVDIALPLDRVLALFDNEENMYKWMEGLQSVEHLSGEPGQPGATSRMKFKSGKREIEMVETIVSRNLPAEMTMNYNAGKVHNIVVNRFEKIDDKNTRYVTDQEFQFGGFMKLMAMIMPGAFKKTSQKYLEDFKRFAEAEG